MTGRTGEKHNRVPVGLIAVLLAAALFAFFFAYSGEPRNIGRQLCPGGRCRKLQPWN